MKGTEQLIDRSSEPFEMHNGVKQGCALAPTLFVALLLRHVFGSTTEGIYLRTRSDERLLNLARLEAMTKVREYLVRDMLFADDTAIVPHAQRELQSLMNRFSQAFKDFRFTIILKKTDVTGQHTPSPPTTMTDKLSLDTEIDKRVGKTTKSLARLTSRVWSNPKLTMKTKMAVYNACVLGTLLYGSET